MLNGATAEHGEIRRATTRIDEADSEFFLILGQHRVTRCKLLQNYIFDIQPTALYTFDDILCRADGTCHEMHLRFETDPRHTNRLTNSFL